MKIWLVATLLLLLLVMLRHIQGDTKILREVEILSDDAFRQETFSLKTENTEVAELVIEGFYMQKIRSQDSPGLSHNIETIYVADKNGNRVMYKITIEPSVIGLAQPPSLSLNPNTLRALGG